MGSAARVLLAGLCLLVVGARANAPAPAAAAAPVNVGHLVAFDAGSGKWVSGFPRITSGVVWAVASDGSGGFYVGGDFLRIGGVPCRHLAHVLASRRVDRGWCPAPNRPVRSLLVADGKLFVGGEKFKSIAGAKRDGVAAFSAATGKLLPFNARLEGAYVWDVAYDPYRDRVLLTGELDTIGTPSDHGSLAAFDATTGRWDRRFRPNPDFNHHGDTAVASVVGRRAVFAWGYFEHIGGKERFGSAAIDPVTGKALTLSALAGWEVETAAAEGETILMNVSAPPHSSYFASLARDDGRVLWRAAARMDSYTVSLGASARRVWADANIDDHLAEGSIAELICFERSTGKRCPAMLVPRVSVPFTASSADPVIASIAANEKLVVVGGFLNRLIQR